MTVLGGCTFDISNIQDKINNLQNQITETRKLFEKKNLNSNTMPLKMVDK